MLNKFVPGFDIDAFMKEQYFLRSSDDYDHVLTGYSRKEKKR